MKIEETGFDGLFILTPTIYNDDRGYFMESYNNRVLEEIGLDINFVQDNQSKSKFGVLRGFHFQKEPHSQTKLIRTLSGEIQDVVIDMRENSATYKKTFEIVLSESNNKQLLVPKGFAHAFLVLSNHAEIFYKCDDYYYPEFESGILYNDPDLGIDWKLKENQIVISEKDSKLPFIKDI